MPLPRFRVRTLMIAVAVVASVLGYVTWLFRSFDHFTVSMPAFLTSLLIAVTVPALAWTHSSVERYKAAGEDVDFPAATGTFLLALAFAFGVACSLLFLRVAFMPALG